MMVSKMNVKADADILDLVRTPAKAGIVLENWWDFECHDKDGNLLWTERAKNLVTTVGLNDILDKYLKGSSYTAAWYVGLLSATPTLAAGDTMSSHAGWTEVTSYDESVRQTLTLGTVSGGSVDNSASKAQFTINAAVTAGGAFVTTNSTKSGTSGTLYAEVAFTSGNKSLADTNVLSVTITLTAASA